MAKATGVDFAPLKAEPKAAHDLKRMRIGMYQRYRGGNMDEGWTRWIFEQFAFQFKNVYDAEIKKGNLNASYDVFIFADDSTGAITGDPSARRGGGGGEFGPARFDGVPDTTPPEYRSGIGDDGVNAIKEFVQKGGTLVTLGGATDFAIYAARPAGAQRRRRRRARRSSSARARRSASRSTTRIPLAYGMPAEGLVLFHYSPAFDVVATDFNDRNDIIVRYADRRRRAERLAERREVHRGQDGDGVARLRAGARRADRIPHAEPRADARDLQVPVQRAGDAAGADAAGRERRAVTGD